MKFYDVESEFPFGKYEGKTLQEVFDMDPKYIDFCFNNYDEFYVSPDVMKELKNINPKIISSATVEGLGDMNDDELDSYFEEAEEIEEIEADDFNEVELEWDEDDDIAGISDDDFESFDDFDDDDDY